MNKKVVWIVGLIIAASAIFLLARSVYNKDDRSADINVEPNPVETANTDSTNSQSASIPENYVKLAKSTKDSASFEFEIPVKPEDINGQNIYHCVVNVSARAESEDAKPECINANTENKFSIIFDANKQTVTISATDLSEWGENNGPFRIGCAACISAIKFVNIHSVDGQVLRDKLVSVY